MYTLKALALIWLGATVIWGHMVYREDTVKRFTYWQHLAAAAWWTAVFLGAAAAVVKGAWMLMPFRDIG
jgi:hypothetical protein